MVLPMISYNITFNHQNYDVFFGHGDSEEQKSQVDGYPRVS